MNEIVATYQLDIIWVLFQHISKMSTFRIIPQIQISLHYPKGVGGVRKLLTFCLAWLRL